MVEKELRWVEEKKKGTESEELSAGPVANGSRQASWGIYFLFQNTKAIN